MSDVVNYEDSDYDLVDVRDNSSAVQWQSDQSNAPHEERSLGSNGTKPMKCIGYNQNFVFKMLFACVENFVSKSMNLRYFLKSWL